MQRTSITLEDDVLEMGKRNAAKRGFSQSFSAYVAWLIQRDNEGAVAREDVVRQLLEDAAEAARLRSKSNEEAPQQKSPDQHRAPRRKKPKSGES